MGINTDSFLKAVKGHVNAEAALADVKDKVYYDKLAEKAAKPYLYYRIVGDSHTDCFGNKSFDEFRVEFNAYAYDNDKATAYVNALNETFTTKSMSMDTGKCLGVVNMGVTCRNDGKDVNAAEVYKGTITLKFFISN